MKKRITITVFAVILTAASTFFGVRQAARVTQRVKDLEGEIARLERKVGASETKKRGEEVTIFTPDGKLLMTKDAKSLRVWQLPQASQNSNGAALIPSAVPSGNAVPPGWQPREFNGMTYYLVPLANEPGRTMQLGSLK